MGCHNVVQEGKITGLFLDSSWCEKHRKRLANYFIKLDKAQVKKDKKEYVRLIEAISKYSVRILDGMLTDPNYKF